MTAVGAGARGGVGPAPGADSGNRRRWRIPSGPWSRIGAGWQRIPRAGRACLLIAFVNAAVWGVVVPPFQVPDEITHFGYAQYLAETGKAPPQGSGAQYSPQEQSALEGLNFFPVIGRPSERGILTARENDALRAAIAGKSPVGQGGSSSASNQPPLYYALEAIPYWLSPSHEILNRLVFMRLLSALMDALTVLAVFMFLRELLPGSPWTWTVGALAVAFQPMVDFIAAGVHGDNLLFLTSAVTFLLLLRTYKRGLTMRRALAIGAVTAAGILTKLTFLSLLPGIALALALIGWRALPSGRTRTLRAVAAAAAVVVVPVLIYGLLNVTVWHRGSVTAGGTAVATSSSLPGGSVITLHQTLDYIWQLYLPRLWFMNHTYFTSYPLIAIWLNESIGHFGWLDYTFPSWVYTDGHYIFYALTALALVGLVRVRAQIRQLLPIFGCFAVMGVGLLAAIGYTGIRYRLSTGDQFEQARYLFPLLVFYALFLVMAARGVGRRWAPALGGAIVVLAMTHGLFAETLTISRYYG